MNPISFSCTALPANKKGILTPDEHGYYEVVIGGLNVFNSAGHYYTYEGARELFEGSSTFMRKVNNGTLYGELGHPRYIPGQSENEYYARIIDILETNTAVHFSKVWLDMERVRDNAGKPVIAIMALAKGDGPHGAAMNANLANPKANTCFSIRSFTEDTYVAGVRHRNIKEIVTFDWVGESGINFARKYNAPALESHDLYERLVNPKEMREALMAPVPQGVGLESRRFGIEVLQRLGFNADIGDLPGWAKW